MAANSKIEWTDHTVNFWIGCTKVSPACDHCYAERDWAMTGRHRRVEWGPHGARSPTKDPMAQVRKIASGAVRRGRRERVFVNSLSDWADNHKSIAPEWRAQIFEAARLYPGLDFLVLTKRPQNIASFLPADWGAGYTNVWLGTTVENQEEADRRIPDLLATPAAVRFLSAEPLLGPISFERVGTLDSIESALPEIVARERRGRPPSGAGSICGAQIDAIGSSTVSTAFFQTPDHMGGFTCASPRRWPRINWVIVGGESGPGARPMHPAWARSIRNQCAEAGVAFFFKQWGEWVSVSEVAGPGPHHEFSDFARVRRVGKARAGRTLDGRTHDDMPAAMARHEKEAAE